MKVKKIILALCIVFSLICVTACDEEPTPKPNPSVQETEYTVSFNTQGGNTIESKKAKKDATITNPGTPTREGYTFGGWYKDAACNTSWDFASDKVTGNITLYAKWTKNETPTPPTPENKYSVTYVINGHGTQPTNLIDQTKLPDTLPVLTAEGWTFEGWYTDEALTKEAKSGTALTANITLYARWTDSSKKNITGVTFQNVTVTYDGSEHSVLVSGSLPAGVNVSYSNNKAVNAGTYNATATLTGDGYNTLKLSASLIINKATFQGLSLPDQTLAFDNEYHTLELKGALPANSNVTYSCSSSSNGKVKDAGQYQITATVTNSNYVTATYKGTLTISKAEFAENSISFRNERFSYDGTAKTIVIAGQLPAGSSVSYSCVEDSTITNSATEVGKYTIKATISNPNYVTKTLTATLEITASEKERHMISYNGVLYFANALDGDKLYSYANGEVARVSSDIPYNFTVLNNTLYFRSYSLFGSSIKKLNDKVELVISEKGEYLCTDGTNLYFVVNGLTASNSGIYKLNPNSASATLLSTGKAKHLTYSNGYLYFADGSNGWKLSRLSVSGGSRTLVVDEKITCLTVANNTLFFTVDNLLGNYIGSYNLSTNVSRKLTRDAGSNLTVIGNDLYYINVDLISSTLNGKGIYVVDAYPTEDKQAAGVRIIGEENESYSSLTLVGSNSLGFYKVSTQMLCVYDIQNSQEIDVLDGFVAPEVVPLSTGSKLIPYGNVLYYLDLYNDKALYSYDPITKVRSRITSNKVSDFAIIGDDLYYNAVSLGVNNSLYKVSLKNGGVPEKISDYDCNDIVTDGSNLYYVEKNAAGVRTAIHKIDSTSDRIIYSKGVEYLTYYKGYLYFLDGKDLLKISVNDTANVITVKKGNTDAFIIHNDVIYFREMHGLAWAVKNLSKMNLDGSNETVLMETNTDPLKIVVYENKLYYYSDTTKESGIYCLDLANPTKTPELIVERGSQYFAEEFTIFNGNIYFVNYYNNLGDSHLYKVNILTKQIENLDA